MVATVGAGIDFELPPSTSEFQTRWVFVDVGVLSPLLSSPSAAAIPNSGWCHQRLADSRLAPIWLRLKWLKDLDVTTPMVVKEFIQR